MTQTDQPVSNAQSASTLARLAWLLLICAALYICYFHNLGAIGLVGPDEPRYAWIARDMSETGDWVTPRLYGKPWFEKPPLFYWGAALCFRLFGVSEVTARLPSAVSALLATLAMAWLAWRVYGAETARWLLLLLPTTVGMIGFSHAAAMDMPFSAMLTIAMVFAAHLLGLVPSSSSEPSTSFTSSDSFHSLCFGIFLGLAVLAKGPAAIVLSGGAVLLWAIFTKRWSDAFRCLHPVAIASFCLTALPWHILCARRNPDFFRIFIIEHNFKRYLTPEFQHIQPFWFYVPILLVAVLPWAIVLVFTVIQALLKVWREREAPSGVGLFLICWALVPVLFFSASKSKLPGYILPSVPILAVILGLAMNSAKGSLRRSAVVSLCTSALGSVSAAFVFFAYPRAFSRFSDLRPLLAVLCATIAVMLGLLAVVLHMKSRPYISGTLQICAFAIYLALFALAGDTNTLRETGLCTLSAKDVVITLKAYGGTSDNVRLVGLKRSTQYQIAFYLHGAPRDWSGEAKEGDLLLGENIWCSQLKSNLECVDLWGWTDMPDGWALLKISPPQ